MLILKVMKILPIKVGNNTFFLNEDEWKANKAFREERERNLRPMIIKAKEML